MTKPKPKPPIDRENAVDVTPVASNDQAFPLPPDPQYLVKMLPGATIAETMEIMMALLFQAVGAPIAGDKGSMAHFALRESYVQKLSDSAARHTMKVPDEVQPQVG